MPARIVVLVSGAGTNLQALLDACADPGYGATVVGVGADRDGIPGLERARGAGVDTFVVRLSDFPDRAAWDAAMAERIAGYVPDLVVLAGFMKILGDACLSRFPHRIVNTHPALLPAFPGGHAVREALEYGVKVTGVTVHIVDAGVDTGPVIAQAAVPVRAGDDESALHERIKRAEREVLVDVVGRMVRDGYTVEGRDVRLGEGAPAIRRALVSVYDKTGLVELGTGLHDAGVEVVSTGSTAAALERVGVPVTPVAQVTGFPECLGGRVKTLHPAVHAGILAEADNPEHVRQLDELGIAAFDLVVVNLYPFRETVASGAGPEECVEQIDIGGPAMVRAAAKNHASVAVVVDPAEYERVLAAARGGGFDLAERRRLAALAFQHTASYDVAVASYLTSALAPGLVADGFPNWVGAQWTRSRVLRYGENPHQRAALYAGSDGAGGLAQAETLHGKPMSYNNYVDADAAWRAAHDFAEPCVAIIKHANPCGIAIGTDVAEAHRAAHACDPVSAFGGVIATNRTVTAAMARRVADVFTEVVVAPDYDDEAMAVLTRKKNIRLLRCPPPPAGPATEWRAVSGGLLMQTTDRLDAAGDDPSRWELRAGPPADAETLVDLAFAWRAVRAVKSNAILLARRGATVGIGMGQVNRVDAVRLAVSRAGERAGDSVAASDAFFPFPDGLQELAAAGIRAVAEPGGSVRDAEVVEAAERAGVTLYFTGTRHFWH